MPKSVEGVVDTTGVGDSLNGGYIASQMLKKRPAVLPNLPIKLQVA